MKPTLLDEKFLQFCVCHGIRILLYVSLVCTHILNSCERFIFSIVQIAFCFRGGGGPLPYTFILLFCVSLL